MSTQKNRKKKSRNITISDETHENLRRLASEDGRTLSGYLDFHFHPDRNKEAQK